MFSSQIIFPAANVTYKNFRKTNNEDKAEAAIHATSFKAEESKIIANNLLKSLNTINNIHIINDDKNNNSSNQENKEDQLLKNQTFLNENNNSIQIPIPSINTNGNKTNLIIINNISNNNNTSKLVNKTLKNLQNQSNQIPRSEIPASHKYFIPKHNNLSQREKEKLLHNYNNKNNKNLRGEHPNDFQSIYLYKKIMDLERKYSPEIRLHEENRDYPHPCVRGETSFKHYSYRSLDNQIKTKNFLEKEILNNNNNNDSNNNTLKGVNNANADVAHLNKENNSKVNNSNHNNVDNSNDQQRLFYKKYNYVNNEIHTFELQRAEGAGGANENNGKIGNKEISNNINIKMPDANNNLNVNKKSPNKNKHNDNTNLFELLNAKYKKVYTNLKNISKNSVRNFNNFHNFSKYSEITSSQNQNQMNTILNENKNDENFDTENILLNNKNKKFLEDKDVLSYNDHYVNYILNKNLKSNFKKIIKISKLENSNNDKRESNMRKNQMKSNNSNMSTNLNNLNSNRNNGYNGGDINNKGNIYSVKNSYLNDQLNVTPRNMIPLEIRYLIDKKFISSEHKDL